jgi:hypothetical protein
LLNCCLFDGAAKNSVHIAWADWMLLKNEFHTMMPETVLLALPFALRDGENYEKRQSG